MPDMVTLPQLIEEDIEQLNGVLRELLAHTEASTALIIDRGGFLISSRGESRDFDLTTIAALAAGAFGANQSIASLVHEPHFDSIYQQGQQFSMFVLAVDDHCLLVVIFRAEVSVGLVKYYAGPAGQRISNQVKTAFARNPNAGLDLSELNLSDASTVFRRRTDV